MRCGRAEPLYQNRTNRNARGLAAILAGLRPSAQAALRRRPRAQLRRGRLALISALLLVPSAALVWLAGEWTRDAALAETRRNAVASLSLHASALRSDLEKYRSVAFMLAQDTDVAVLLDQPSDPSATDRVNRKLERLAEGTRAAVLYVLDASGKAIAASN
jgi:two-component system C4-dicarboxylate transport sensor histidine kinase DctB